MTITHSRPTTLARQFSERQHKLGDTRIFRNHGHAFPRRTRPRAHRQRDARRSQPSLLPIFSRESILLATVSATLPITKEVVGMVSDANTVPCASPCCRRTTAIARSGAIQLGKFRPRTTISSIDPVRQASHLDPALPFTEIETMSDEVADSAAGERLTATLASVFGDPGRPARRCGSGFLAYAVAQRRARSGFAWRRHASRRYRQNDRPANALAMVAAGVTPASARQS